jgi:hypothetical protein
MAGAWRSVHRESSGQPRYTSPRCDDSVVLHDGDSEDGLLLAAFFDIPTFEQKYDWLCTEPRCYNYGQRISEHVNHRHVFLN